MDAIAPGPCPTNQPNQPTYQQRRRRRKEVQLRILRPSYLRSRRSGVSFNPISLQPRKGTLRLLTADKKQYPYNSILPALRGSPSIDTNYFDIFLYFVPIKSNDIKSQCGWSSVRLAHRELANTVFTLDHLFDLVCSQSGKFSLALVEPPYTTNQLCMYLQLATYIEP